LKFAPMAIPAMALLQQHDVRRDILIKPAACVQRSKLGGIPNWGHSELQGAQSGRKKQPACLCVSDRHFYPSTLTDFDDYMVAMTLL